MGITQRITAAYNAFTGREPQGKAVQEPFFFNYTMGNLGVSTQNTRISYQMLRAFSESPIPRRAIDYIRNQVSRLEWDVAAKHGKRLTAAQQRQVDILKNVLSNPNFDDSWMSFLGQTIEDMLVIGQSATEIKPWLKNAERPLVLYPVDAASIQIYLDWDGSPDKPRYAQIDLHGGKVDFKASEMLVMKHTPRSNTPFGLSPIEVCIQQIQYLLDAQTYAGKTASNSTPKKLLWLGKDLSLPQLNEFRRYFRDDIEGRSHIPIIGGGDEPKSIELGLIGDQSIFLQWQSFLIAIIANTFNLDAMKFNAFVGINRSTGDVLDDVSDEGAIRPMAQQIEHYVNQFFMPLFGLGAVAEFKFRFTTSYQDRKSLAVIHQVELQADKITINEARRDSGYPDLPFDPLIGQSKGDLTLSEYRAIYGGFVSLQDAVGIDGDTKTTNSTSVNGKVQVEKAKQAAKGDGTDGNNGVNGAAKPKEAPNNARTDKGTSITL